MLFAFLTVAQEPIHKHYKLQDGLPSNESHFTISDSKGFMWIATDAGICKFNGTRFITFSLGQGLPENVVLRLYEDKKGRMWFSTLSSYIGYIENDVVHNIPGQFREDIVKFGNNWAYSMYVDDADTLWVGTIVSGLLYKLAYPYTQPAIKKYMDKDFVIEFNEEGDYIYGTYNSMNMMLKKTRYTTFSYQQKWKSKEKTVTKDASLGERKRIVKLAPHDFLFDDGNKVYRTKNGKTSLFKEFDDKVAFIHILDSMLWIGVFNKGLYQYPNADFSDQYTLHQVNKHSTWIATDLEGGYWISSLYKGTTYIPHFGFTQLLNRLGENEINKIYQWNATQLMVNETMGDIYLLDHDTILKSYDVSAVTFSILPESKKAIFYSMKSKHSVLDISTEKTKSTYITLNQVKTPMSSTNFHRGVDSVLYAIGSAGAYRYDVIENEFELLHYFPNRLTDVLVDRNNIMWTATLQGLYSLHLDTKEVKEWSDKSASLSTRIDHLAQDTSNIWMGTRGKGVLCFDKKKRLTNFNARQGLPSDFITALYVDAYENVWVGTTQGLAKIYPSHKVENYAYLNGFNYGKINDILRVGDSLYVAASNGLYRLRISQLGNVHRQTLPIPLYVTRVRSTNRNTIRNGETLDYEDNTVSFSYTSISFSHAENISYQYKLEGLSDTWNATQNQYIRFLNLPPGEYSFKVNIKNGSEASMETFNFTISTPFWRTWWFVSLESFTILLLLYLAFLTRLRFLNRKQQLKLEGQIVLAKSQAASLRAQMNPHFTFNAINSIQHFILKNDAKSAYQYLSKFSKLIRNILEMSKYETTTVEKERLFLQDYLDLEQLRMSNRFEYELNVEDLLNQELLLIPSMLVQPMVENAIVHGVNPLTTRKGKIIITFKVDSNYLVCTIADNGVGRQKADEIKQRKEVYHTSMAHSILEERLSVINTMNELKAKVITTDLYDDDGHPMGTKVELWVPILKKHE